MVSCSLAHAELVNKRKLTCYFENVISLSRLVDGISKKFHLSNESGPGCSTLYLQGEKEKSAPCVLIVQLESSSPSEGELKNEYYPI